MGIRTSKSIILLLVFAFFFSACRSNIPPATPTLPERTVQPPSRYTTPQNTLTPPLPSPTRTLAIWTHPPLPTNMPPNTRTWTPHPTLPTDEAQRAILELIDTNGGCRLPCWWGITPGETTWAQAWAILSPFMVDYWSSPYVDGVYSLTFGVPTNYRQSGRDSVRLIIRDNIVDTIRYFLPKSLQGFLEEYGLPEQVFLYTTMGLNPEYIGDFYLVMFYTDQGMMVAYHGEMEFGQIMDICPSRILTLGSMVWLWSPNQSRTFEEVATPDLLGYPPYPSDYYPIAEVSDMDVTAFYQTLVDPNNASVCIEVDNPDLP